MFKFFDMEKIKLLLVDDNKDYAYVVERSLKVKGVYDICIAYNGKEGLELYRSFKPDIIVTDIEMPIMNGNKMVRIIRENDTSTPVFFLTSHKEPEEHLAGMEAGADFYILKLISVDALDIQIRKYLERISNKPLPVKGIDECSIGSFGFSASNKYLLRNGKRTNLTFMEAKILNLLVAKKGGLVLKEEILNNFNDIQIMMSPRTLDVHMRNVRKKLIEDPSVKIVTSRKEGYILED